MDKKFVIATIAAFVVGFVLAFLFHGVLLAPDYMQHLAVYRGPQFRPEMFAIIVVMQLLMAGAMAGIYRFGMQDRPFVGQGLRFGLLVAAASVIPCYAIGYAVTNISGALAIKQIVLETAIVLAMALVIAWFYRGEQRA
jgi:hypothetical protein